MTDKTFTVRYTITISGTTEVEAEDKDDAEDVVDGWDISDYGDFAIGDMEVDVEYEVEEAQEKVSPPAEESNAE